MAVPAKIKLKNVNLKKSMCDLFEIDINDLEQPDTIFHSVYGDVDLF